MLQRASLLLSAFLVACSAEDASQSDQEAPIAQPTPSADDPVAPPPVEDGWCARIAGGLGVDEAKPALALSEAHAWVRYFGAAGSQREIDEALVDGIASADNEVDERAAAAFGSSIESVCFVAANDRPLPDAKVTKHGGVAIVQPGRGDVVVPSDATAVAIDLRGLPGTPEGADAAQAAVAAVLAQPLAPISERVQVRTGFTDEAFTEQSLYGVTIESLPVAGPTPRASDARPLAVIVGPTIAPAAARLALHLRATQRAWLLGEDLEVAVAETRWTATGKLRGLAYRVFDLLDAGGKRFGDVVPADGAADDASIDAIATRGTPPALTRGSAARTAIATRRDFGEVQALTPSVASARAALLSAHGAAKLFFPYFGTIGDVTDARLLETLDAAKTIEDRNAVRQLLRRFGNALADGHNWVIDGAFRGGKTMPVMLDRVGGLPVVSRSYFPALATGDTLLQIDGTEAGAWFEREMARSYGATEGHRFFLAASELTQTSPPKTLRVRAPSGAERDVAVTPVGSSSLPLGTELFAGSTRKRGWLADLGAPDVYYFNLDGRYVDGDADMIAGLNEASTARALVLDMRGHPATGTPWDPYSFLQRIIPASFSSPKYRVPVVAGNGERTDVHPYEATYSPLVAPSFAGPVVLITDHQAVSFAEDFSLMLAGANRATVVGRPTAGTTGSVSGMQLPGNFQFFFTGMEARWPDGRTHFGVGVVPSVVVSPTVQDYAQKKDPFLTAAIGALSN